MQKDFHQISKIHIPKIPTHSWIKYISKESLVVNKGGIAFPAARTPATVAGLLDSAIVADIAVAIAVICVRAAVVIFIPILDGGAIAPDGIKAACNVVKLAVALPKFTVTGAIAAA